PPRWPGTLPPCCREGGPRADGRSRTEPGPTAGGAAGLAPAGLRPPVARVPPGGNLTSVTPEAAEKIHLHQKFTQSGGWCRKNQVPLLQRGEGARFSGRIRSA